MESEAPETMTGSTRERTLGYVLLDLLGVITKWRRLVAWVVVTFTVAAVLIAVVSPKWYKAT